ncbi:MAG: hypothetical protein JRI44_02945 [Deltaproteobacteria bacterium]|nr:hypothetical protein [Deltaproteobacteria bacterium]
MNKNIEKDILSFIEKRLKKIHKPDPDLVRKHNADPLNKDWQIPQDSLWEQSDVVHDILAFLASKMIELNKEKQKEINGFLSYLEMLIDIIPDEKGRTGIDTLTGRSKIKNYLGDYQKNEEPLSFEEFFRILERNKNKIQANLKNRKVYELIKAEYEKSLSKLLIVKEKLKKTDWLIDQIVYKLYGISDDEIKVIEEKS